LNSTHIIPSREEILGIFRSAKAPLDLRTLALALKVKADSHAVLTRRLNAMERDGQIRSDTGGFYVLADHSEFIAGRVSSHRDGYGFLIPDEPGEDLFLAEREMQKVLHGDKVLGRITGYDRRGRPEGTIVEVVQRGTTHIIGRLLKENGAWVVAPEDKRISQDILVQGAVGKAKSGQIVSVELTEQPGRFKQPSGRIVEVLGDMDDPGMEIEIAVRKFGVPHIFSDAALKQASKLPDVVHEADWGERVDLRDVPLVTIDGEDARDFDDAVYCEPIKLGRSKAFRLIVAIADVSHYVKPNDGLDGDAIERSTSVYFPRRVIPMLPEKLSNGLCSLNPHVDRLTLVCDAVITADGELKAYQFYPADLYRSGGHPWQYQGSGSGAPRGNRAAPAKPVRHLPCAAEVAPGARCDRFRDHRNLYRLQPVRQDREDHPAHPQRCAQADRRMHAGGERVRGGPAAAPQAPRHLPHPRRPDQGKADPGARLPQAARPVAGRRRYAGGARLRRLDEKDQGTAGRAAAANHAAALDAAGGLQP
jgi:ribonuclease R